MFCNRCGTANADEVRFCVRCGTALLKPGSAQPSATPPEYNLPGFRESGPSFYQPYQPYPAQGAQLHQSHPGAYTPMQGGASARAIASMILSLISIVSCGPFLSVPGLIMGKLELDAIRAGQAPVAGETFAKVGFYAGIAITVISCLAGFAYLLFVFAIAGAST